MRRLTKLKKLNISLTSELDTLKVTKAKMSLASKIRRTDVTQGSARKWLRW